VTSQPSGPRIFSNKTRYQSIVVTAAVEEGMWLLWVAIILFAIWVACLAVVKAITGGMWILLGFAVAFLIVHFFTRRQMKTWQLRP
jgi:F0F1-type ATP synthase assembly protein I